MCNPLLLPPSPCADEARDAFAARLLETVNHAGTALMLSIGHRTGLFDRMDGMPPSTSREIAAEANLDERYVRESLAAMTVAGIVDYDADRQAFSLPPTHAACLTRRATPDNMAVFMQYVALLGGVEDEIVECFRRGGGVPYERFRRFHEVMAEESGQVVDAALIESVLPLVPGLAGRLARGIDVLDVGCGSGRALLRLAREFPASRYRGIDFSAEAIGRARAAAEAAGLDNLRFEARDAAELDERERYDLVTTFDAVHDQARPAEVLAAIRRALRPGGVYLMQDIAGSSRLEGNLGHPLAPFLYTISTMHCMTVSLALGGAGLGTLWGEERALAMLDEAGFTKVAVHRIAGDIQNNYYAARAAA